jgi:hypothetical protein
VPQRAVLISIVLSLAAAPLGCGNTGSPRDRGETQRSSVTATSKLYQSKAFVVPLTVTVDTKALTFEPTLDSKNLLFWQSKATIDEKVRFLVPVEVDRDSGPPVDPPRHYLKYLRGLSKRGAKFSEAAHMTVDGRAVTLLTATTPNPLDGTLGCSVAGGDPDLECFGLQPDLILRIAVVDIGRTPFVAWARIPAERPDPAFERTFEAMLKTVRFR